MGMTMAGLKALSLRYRFQSEVIGVSTLAIVVALTLGVMARRQAAPLTAERDRLRAATREIDTFRAAFQPLSAEEDAYRLPDTLAVGVVRDVRFTLAQQVSQRAEQAGLRDVRVRFAPLDSGAAPRVPDIPGAHIAVADYVISLDCHGDLASVLGMLRTLPTSVALKHLTAVRNGKGFVDYHISLSVFEAAAEPAHG